MIRAAILSTALVVAVPALAQDEPGPAPAPAADVSNFDLAKEKVVDCAGEKFVFAWGAGARPTKVTLCSDKGASTREVVTMLEDAAVKIEQTESISQDRRNAIAQQIRAKIAELTGAKPQTPAPAASAQAAPAPDPLAPASAPAAAEQSVAVPPVQPVTAPARPAPPRLAPKPRLTFSCYTPGDIGSGGPCTLLGRETRLTVRSDAAVPGGIDLRFVRSGQVRGDIALGAMRKGQSQRLVIPRELCSGVSEAEAEIHVVSDGQVVDTLGPYLLRC